MIYLLQQKKIILLKKFTYKLLDCVHRSHLLLFFLSQIRVSFNIIIIIIIVIIIIVTIIIIIIVIIIVIMVIVIIIIIIVIIVIYYQI